MSQVMISYRNLPEQKAFAEELNEAFKAVGVDTWLDTEQLTEAIEWENAIIDGIKNSDYVAVCLSEDYFESEICLMECYIARGYRKKILPIWVSNNTGLNPFELISRHPETEGLEYKSVAKLNLQDLWGLPLTRYERIKRIVDSVANPISHETVYKVYISYKYHQAKFATKVADSLNDEGLSTFIMTKHVNIGDDHNEVAWNAMLQAKYHISIITPDIKDSVYIKNELRLAKTRNTKYLSIAAETLIGEEQLKKDIRASFRATEFDILNKTQWFRLDEGYDIMIEKLIKVVSS